MPFNPLSLFSDVAYENVFDQLISMQTVQSSPWAILLCKFSDTEEHGQTRGFYEELFTGAGSGTLNMVDFFRDMSHGMLDLSKSRVFGWYTLSYRHADYIGNSPAAPGKLDRMGLIAAGRQAASSATDPLQKVDFSKFGGVVVVMAGQVDLFGVTGGMAAVCDDLSLQPSLLGQEMGHGYGLDHSRKQGDLDDYQDPWDIMSTYSDLEAPNATYTDVGPGLNAWNMRSRGWLDEDRVWKTNSPDASFFLTDVDLRPLHRIDLRGYLAAEIGQYLVEFRVPERWDAGISPSCVLVHHFEDNHSYIMPGTGGNYDLHAGDTFQIGSPDSIFGQLKVHVNSINPEGHTANVGLTRSAPYRAPSLTGTLYGGVAQDGYGGVLIGHEFHPVPPRGPESIILRELASALVSRNLSDPLLAQRAKSLSLARIAETCLKHLKDTSDVTRSPRMADRTRSSRGHNVSPQSCSGRK